MNPTATAGPKSARRRVAAAVVIALVLALLAAGTTGAFQYVRTYWLYRGFPPPFLPKTVTVRVDGRQETFKVRAGLEQRILVRSPALGGRAELVFVYLPPGYSTHPYERYPALYLLHGTPGAAVNFLQVGDLAVQEDLLVAEHRIHPMILVVPTGSLSFFADTEWANGVRADSGWETYLVRDVVQAIDHRYRAIRSGYGRGLAGLSEGGYGALNALVHHPREFNLVESWSGYEWAQHVPAVFGAHPPRSLLAYDSPFLQIPRVAAGLRRRHAFIWFFTGAYDSLRRENARFASELGHLGIGHRFFVVPAESHNWRLWRSMAGQALVVASHHLRGPGTGRKARG